MEAMNDRELLRRYAASHCDAAFTELVRLYVDLVYCAALPENDCNRCRQSRFLN